MIGLTYALPVGIIDVTLSQSSADLRLPFLGQLIVAVEQGVVEFIGRKSLLPGLGDVVNHLGSGAAPMWS